MRTGYYVFCERSTGLPRFRVAADEKGNLPQDEAASLLAMHCLMRGQAPADYVVMVAGTPDLLRGVTSRARQLLDLGRASLYPMRLSRREQEVLLGVSRHLANKEIAAELNLSERTVKFHVSALLAKFRVPDRVSLMLEATRTTLPSRVDVNPAAFAPPPGPLRPLPATGSRLPAPSPAAGRNVLRLPSRNSSA